MRLHVLVCMHVLTWFYCTRTVSGHGRLIDPPSRATMWRYGFPTPHNYNDNQLYCGGVQVQYEINGGKCGVCGDAWNGPREHEPPGKFATGMIVRKYSPGDTITVVIELTANHKGWMEFRLCENDDPTRQVTQECFDEHVLHLADSNSPKFYIPNDKGYQKFHINVRLPPEVTCKDCVFQWKYNAGNSWGTDATGRGCIGCGNQEQFYGCADVAIGHDDVEIPPHNTLPADMDDDESDDVKPVIPRIPDLTETKWRGVTKSWRPTEEIDSKTQELISESIDFMPVMNTNGMNPCMCICKRAPLKLKDGKKNNLEAKFFEGLEGKDNQVCMCMCQNTSSRASVSIILVVCALIVAKFLTKLRHS